MAGISPCGIEDKLGAVSSGTMPEVLGDSAREDFASINESSGIALGTFSSSLKSADATLRGSCTAIKGSGDVRNVTLTSSRGTADVLETAEGLGVGE